MPFTALFDKVFAPAKQQFLSNSVQKNYRFWSLSELCLFLCHFFVFVFLFSGEQISFIYMGFLAFLRYPWITYPHFLRAFQNEFKFFLAM